MIHECTNILYQSRKRLSIVWKKAGVQKWTHKVCEQANGNCILEQEMCHSDSLYATVHYHQCRRLLSSVTRPAYSNIGWFQTIAVSHDGALYTAIRHTVDINSDHAARRSWALPEVAVCPMKSTAGIVSIWTQQNNSYIFYDGWLKRRPMRLEVQPAEIQPAQHAVRGILYQRNMQHAICNTQYAIRN